MVKEYFSKHIEIYEKLDFNAFEVGIELVRKALNRGAKVLTCGNGGSALTASHYITDWNKAISNGIGIPVHGISLVDNIGLVTAYANDVSYDEVFSRQLEYILDKKDLVIAISGSGNSSNVVNAVKYANEVGAETLAVVGYDGGELKKISKHFIWIPSFDMQICEDIQLMFGHIVAKKLITGNMK